MRNRRDVQGMMWRDDVGRVDLPWGRPGHKFPSEFETEQGKLTKKTHTDGYGASHILDKHDEEALRMVPAILADGEILPQSDPLKLRIRKGTWILILGRENADSAFAVSAMDLDRSAGIGSKPLRPAPAKRPPSKVRLKRQERRAAAFWKTTKE